MRVRWFGFYFSFVRILIFFNAGNSVFSRHDDGTVDTLPHAQKRFFNTLCYFSNIGHIPRKFILGLIQKRENRFIDRIVDLIKTFCLRTAKFWILFI